MLAGPVVLEISASAPTATFSVPVVFAPKAFEPIAVLFEAVVLASKAAFPTATFSAPEVLAPKASDPTAVLFEPVFASNAA